MRMIPFLYRVGSGARGDKKKIFWNPPTHPWGFVYGEGAKCIFSGRGALPFTQPLNPCARQLKRNQWAVVRYMNILMEYVSLYIFFGMKNIILGDMIVPSSVKSCHVCFWGLTQLLSSRPQYGRRCAPGQPCLTRKASIRCTILSGGV